jgi:hypothetical protein
MEEPISRIAVILVRALGVYAWAEGAHKNIERNL